MLTAMQPSPSTPPATYQPRIFKVRIWVKGGPFEGTRIFFKAPYGTAVATAEVLARAVTTGQISRFTYGPASARDFRTLDRKTLKRFYEAAFELALKHGINWNA
jgi:hypothetical protein